MSHQSLFEIVRVHAKQLDDWPDPPEGEKYPQEMWELRAQTVSELVELLGDGDALDALDKDQYVQLIGWCSTYRPLANFIMLQALGRTVQ